VDERGGVVVDDVGEDDEGGGVDKDGVNAECVEWMCLVQ